MQFYLSPSSGNLTLGLGSSLISRNTAPMLRHTCFKPLCKQSAGRKYTCTISFKLTNWYPSCWNSKPCHVTPPLFGRKTAFIFLITRRPKAPKFSKDSQGFTDLDFMPKCRARTSNTGSTWGLARKAGSLPHPRTTESESASSQKPQGVLAYI